MSAPDEQLPEVVEGEMVDLDALIPRPLQHPPAVRPMCECGKDGTPYSHGARWDAEGNVLREPFPCDEVLAIRARVEHAARVEQLSLWQRFWARLRGQEPGGWRP